MGAGDLDDRSPESCLEEAIESLGRALELNALSGPAWTAHACALLQADRPDEALSSARRAVALAPRRSAGWVALGRVQLALGLVADARASADRALGARSGVDIEALGLRQAIASAAGVEHSTIDVRPDVLLTISADVWSGQGEDWEGRLHGALAEIDAAPSWREDCDLLVRRGRILLAYARRLPALIDARARVEAAPGDPKCWEALASALYALGRFGESASASRRRVELDPAEASGWVCLGIALERLGNPAEALEAFDAARRLEPEDADLWLNCAEMLQKLGREKQAAPFFHRAMELTEPPMREPPTNG